MKSCDVILVRPKEHEYEYIQWYEDIHLGYVASHLESEGIQFEIFDFALKTTFGQEELAKAIEAVYSLQPKIIVFFVDKHPTNNPFFTYELIQEFERFSGASDRHFTVYGNTQVGYKRFLEEMPIDSIVLGEEKDLIQLVKALRTNTDLDKVPGIAFRNENGSIIVNKPVPLSDDLDHLPFPKRYYFDLFPNGRRYVGALLASRGCYAKCSFCYMRSKEKVYGRYPWRARSPKNVVDEMEILYLNHEVREFLFLDSQFFGPGKEGQTWAKQLAKEILQRDLSGISFSIYARSNDIKEDTIALLKKVGLYAVFVGVENFSQEMLNRLNKGLNVDDNVKAIEILKALDIRIRMGFISLDYFSTLNEVRENLTYLKDICFSHPHLFTQPIFFQNILTPLDDTPTGNMYRSNGYSNSIDNIKTGFLMKEQQNILSRKGDIMDFSNKPELAFLSEAIRILSSEILQRSVILEVLVQKALLDESEFVMIDGLQIKMEQALFWFENLILNVIENIEVILDFCESSKNNHPDELETIAKFICDAADKYDLRYLKTVIDSEVPIREALYC